MGKEENVSRSSSKDGKKDGKKDSKTAETKGGDEGRRRCYWGLWDNPENSGQMLLWAKSPSKAEKGVGEEGGELHDLTTPYLSEGEQEKLKVPGG